jgi:hypothetical protein
MQHFSKYFKEGNVNLYINLSWSLYIFNRQTFTINTLIAPHKSIKFPAGPKSVARRSDAIRC